MPAITVGVRILLGAVSAAALVLAGILGNALLPQITYFIAKRGRKPNARPLRIWLVFAVSAVSGVVLGAGAASLPTREPLPGPSSAPRSSTAPVLPTLTPAAGDDIRAGCISVSQWVPYGEKRDYSSNPGQAVTPVPQNRCWYLYRWGIDAQAGDLRFVSSDDVERGMYGISAHISDNSVVSFTLTLEEWAKSDRLRFGIITDPARPMDEAVLCEIWRWDTGIFSILRFVGGDEETLGGEFRDPYKAPSYGIRIEVVQARFQIYLDGTPLTYKSIDVVYPDFWFWIGYEYSGLWGDSAIRISDLNIQVR